MTKIKIGIVTAWGECGMGYVAKNWIYTIEKYPNGACKVVANIDWDRCIADMDLDRSGMPKGVFDSAGNFNFDLYDSLHSLYNYSNMNKYIVSKTFYHQNGQIILESKYQNGQKEGKWIYHNFDVP